MSTQAPTDKNEETKRLSSFEVLGIPKISLETGDADDAILGINKEHFRQALKGKGKRDSKIPGFLAMGSGAALSKISSVTLDENSQEQLEQLKNTVDSITSALGTVNLVTFGLSAALAAMGLKGDKLKPATPDIKGKAGAPDAPTKAAKGASETLAKLAKDGAEVTTKPVVEAAVEVATKGLFGNILGGALKGLKFLKRVPVLGMAITGGFVAYEVGSFALQKDFQNAGAALAAGTGEIAGNFVGLGAGDALREGIRGAFVVAGGDSFEDVAKSDIRAVGEMGFDLIQEFTGAAAPNNDNAVLPTQRVAFTPQALAHG